MKKNLQCSHFSSKELKKRTGCLDLKAFRGWPAGPSSELPHLQSQRRARHDRSQLLLPTSGDTFSLSSLSNPIRAACLVASLFTKEETEVPGLLSHS